MRKFGVAIGVVLSVLTYTQQVLAQVPAGTLKWEEMADRGGGRDDRMGYVAIAGETAVSTGFRTLNGMRETIVRSYRVPTGQVLWQDTFPGEGRAPITVFGNTVVVTAFSTNGVAMRAYHLITGAIQWASFLPGVGFPYGLVSANSRFSFATDNVVRTFNITNGQLLWAATITHAGWTDMIWSVATDGLSVVTAGTIADHAGVRHLVLRSFDARTGGLQWNNFVPYVAPLAVRISGSEILVAGTLDNGQRSTFLASFIGRDGRVIWYAPTRTGIFFNFSTTSSQVVAVGRGTRGLLVMSVNRANGQTQWEDETNPGSGYGEELMAVALTPRAVYVAGHSWRDFVYSETVVRGYNINGGLIFDNKRQRRVSLLSDIGVSGIHLVAVGYSSASTGSQTDSLIQAYDLSEVEPEFSVDTPLVAPPFSLN